MLRSHLKQMLSSELHLLENEEQLVKIYRTQEKLGSKCLSVRSSDMLVELAKEKKLSIALQLHCTCKNTGLSPVWATVLRDVLGEKFMTENEAKDLHKKAYEDEVQNKTDR